MGVSRLNECCEEVLEHLITLSKGVDSSNSHLSRDVVPDCDDQ